MCYAFCTFFGTCGDLTNGNTFALQPIGIGKVGRCEIPFHVKNMVKNWNNKTSKRLGVVVHSSQLKCTTNKCDVLLGGTTNTLGCPPSQ